MKPMTVLVSATVLASGLLGCGPMQVPMVPRLEEPDQQKVDAAWERATRPVDKLDRQLLLDVLIAHQAFQLGVDKLTFRSEKRVTAGTVVMEIFFDRTRPAEDRFEVTVFDKGGVKLRHERYSRDDVKQAVADLSDPGNTAVGDPCVHQRRKAAYDARVKRIEDAVGKLDVNRDGDLAPPPPEPRP